MLLQPVVMPMSDGLAPHDMYFRSGGATVGAHGSLSLAAGESVSFDTCFCSFFASKWLRYTVIDSLALHLTVEGEGMLRLIAVSLCSGTMERRVIAEHPLASSNGAAEYQLPYGELYGNCVYSFELTADAAPLRLIDAGYHCVVEPLNEVRLAIGICTYRREQYVERTLSRLATQVFARPSSPLHNRLSVYIADNGRTLNADELGDEQVHIFPNKNAGGVGGFTRCILEIRRREPEATHVLLMDDDATVEPSTLERLYIFLSMLRPEHFDVSVGGSLLLEDRPWLQYESGAQWLDGRINVLGNGLDMRRLDSIVADNARDELIDYTGWWFTCMPVTQIEKCGLPLPIFLHRDDVEYGLRLKGRFVTLTGVAVWHEQFERKLTGVSEYYDIRNTLIVSAIHSPDYALICFRRYLTKWFLRNLYSHRYKYIEMNLRGASDALRGILWLKQQDGEALHSEIAAMNYPLLPISELPSYDQLADAPGQYAAQYAEAFSALPVTRSHALGKRLLSVLTVALAGGVWLPLHGRPILALQPSPIWRCFGHDRVIHCDAARYGFETTRDWRALRRCLALYRGVMAEADERFDAVTAQYRARWRELSAPEYWEAYLGLERDEL